MSIPILVAATIGGAGCRTVEGDGTNRSTLIAESGSFEVAMRGVRTVSLHRHARVVAPRPGESPEALRELSDRAISAVLAERGFTVVGPGEGERVIAYGIGIEGVMIDREMVRIFGISAGVDDGRAGTRGGLILAVMHAHTGQVLWRGSASAPAEEPSVGESELDARIRRAARTVMDGRIAPD